MQLCGLIEQLLRHLLDKLLFNQHGMEAVIPTEYVVPSLMILVEERLGDVEPHGRRITTLEKLTKARQLAIHYDNREDEKKIMV